MTGLIRIGHLRDNLRRVAAHIWLADPPELSLAGQDIAVGWWEGTDGEDQADIGQWVIRRDSGCNPPVHFPDDTLTI